jgi:hypothetical protein
MKEVRLNDRFWFGKHKGARICEIIKQDPIFIQKIIKEGKIKLDEKGRILFEQKCGMSVDGAPIGRAQRQTVELPNLQVRNNVVLRRDFINNVTENNVKDILKTVFLQAATHYIGEVPGGRIEGLSTLFTRKIMRGIEDHNIRNCEITIRFSSETLERGLSANRYDDIRVELYNSDQNELINIYDLS